MTPFVQDVPTNALGTARETEWSKEFHSNLHSRFLLQNNYINRIKKYACFHKINNSHLRTIKQDRKYNLFGGILNCFSHSLISAMKKILKQVQLNILVIACLFVNTLKAYDH